MISFALTLHWPLKPRIGIAAVLAVLLLAPVGPLRAEEPPATVRVLIFGNSYSTARASLPKIAASKKRPLELLCLRSQAGENTLKRIEAELACQREFTAAEIAALPEDEAREKYGFVPLESDYKARVHIVKTLQSKSWDFIVIQCHSSVANQAEKWSNAAARIVEVCKTHCPNRNVTFLLYLTTAYRNDDLLYHVTSNSAVYRGAPTLELPYTEDQHYFDARKAHYQVAEKLGLTVVAGGTALQNARYSPLWGEHFPDPNFDYENAKSPAKPDESKTLHVGLSWIAAPTQNGERLWKIDSHPNSLSGYLTACTYFGILFDESPVGAWVPESDKRFKPADYKAMQHIAWDTVRGILPPLRLAHGKSRAAYAELLSQTAGKAAAMQRDDVAISNYRTLLVLFPESKEFETARSYLEKAGELEKTLGDAAAEKRERPVRDRRQQEIWDKHGPKAKPVTVSPGN